MSKKMLKDTAINVRLTTEQKERYSEEAKLCNMKLSEYVLYLLQNKRVTVIENGSEIAHAIYDLNKTLNECINHPNIPISKTKKALSAGILKLNSCLEGMQGEVNVNSAL